MSERERESERRRDGCFSTALRRRSGGDECDVELFRGLILGKTGKKQPIQVSNLVFSFGDEQGGRKKERGDDRQRGRRETMRQTDGERLESEHQEGELREEREEMKLAGGGEKWLK